MEGNKAKAPKFETFIKSNADKMEAYATLFSLGSWIWTAVE
jgi:hypothetical protein